MLGRAASPHDTSQLQALIFEAFRLALISVSKRAAGGRGFNTTKHPGDCAITPFLVRHLLGTRRCNGSAGERVLDSLTTRPPSHCDTKLQCHVSRPFHRADAARRPMASAPNVWRHFCLTFADAVVSADALALTSEYNRLKWEASPGPVAPLLSSRGEECRRPG
jgi:hypothetical protein